MLDREDFYTEYSPVVNTQMYPNYEREGSITAQFLFSRQELFKWFENNYEQVPHDSQRYTWSYMDDDTIINGMRLVDVHAYFISRRKWKGERGSIHYIDMDRGEDDEEI